MCTFVVQESCTHCDTGLLWTAGCFPNSMRTSRLSIIKEEARTHAPTHQDSSRRRTSPGVICSIVPNALGTRFLWWSRYVKMALGAKWTVFISRWIDRSTYLDIQGEFYLYYYLLRIPSYNIFWTLLLNEQFSDFFDQIDTIYPLRLLTEISVSLWV